MSTKTKGHKLVCGLLLVTSLFIGADAFAWHYGGRHYNTAWRHHGAWGYHANGWGHHGYGWGHRGYVGYYGGGCRWVGAHWNRFGAWVPAHRAC